MSTVARPRPTGQPEGRKSARPSHGTCRLNLSINGTSYILRPIEADPGVVLRAFRLRKDDGTVYHVADHPHGSECDCPDLMFHRDGLDSAGCKHIKALLACGLFDSRPPYHAPSSTEEWAEWTEADRWTIA